MALGLERAKVMLFVRVVGVAKVVKHRDGLDDAGHGLLGERGDARRRDLVGTPGWRKATGRLVAMALLVFRLKQRREHRAPLLGEGEFAGSVTLDQSSDHQGGGSRASDASPLPFYAAGDAEQ
jgi:hypothetical protein